MSDKPRTWTIEHQWSGAVLATGADTDVHCPIRVIELEPVLDLLERLSMDVGMRDVYQKCWENGTLERARALLREHGRPTEDWELDE